MAERQSPAKTRDALRAAQLYYQQNLTMEAIAEDLSVSRSSVSRLLTHARATGLVEIRIHSPQEARSRIEQRFSERFGITAHVVPGSERQSENERLERTAQAAAQLIAAAVAPRTTIGVAWGSTTSAVARSLPRKPTAETRVVQMNGAANGRTTGVSYATGLLGGFAGAFSAEVYEFPVPAIFDDPTTRTALWRERAVSRVIDLQAAVNLFVFGLGSRIGDPRSHIYSGGYLGNDDLRSLVDQSVVGDCATVFYRADGGTDGIAMNERSSGPRFDVVRRIPQRLCVVSGAAKRDSLRGALAAGIITDLVVDERLARQVLAADSAGS
ncbi:transcriptional regulator [Leucobacter sp. UCD-THU]|uniref:sugar-binding transcriptional regulator n=1 Tax=Leucobacter sp. UCD-THU TaxID=1292023 RepID=UPI000360BC4A|nr:sugar-binding domain-containing protein [Leucobacter sp. UCD-THU]EYT53020.1 transcriptional regulator [Leucobacter sp. UCD-THU]